MFKLLVGITATIITAYLAMLLLVVWNVISIEDETLGKITLTVIIITIILSIAIAIVHSLNEQKRQKSDTGKDLIA